MHERIQFREKTKYSRIVARIPTDLEQACRHLAYNEGWELGDLYRSLILLGACGSFLTLRSRKSRELPSGSSFPSLLKRYWGDECMLLGPENAQDSLQSVCQRVWLTC